MKQFLTFVLCLCLSFPMAACGNEGSAPIDPTPAPPLAAPDTSITEENEQEHEMAQDELSFGLTIDGVDYPLPSTLKQFLDDGWSISPQTPYFLLPMVSGDYYEARANLSLTDDGEGIRVGGSIIRLLEKEGALLEVTIANQTDAQGDGQIQKIEDGIVESITVFYDDAHTSIQLGGMELSSLSQESLLASYPGSDGWTHSPSNFRNHPEFGISAVHDISHHLDNCNRSITVYFNLEDTAFEVTVLNETTL